MNAAGTSYSVQIPFTGGGTKSYTITGGTNTGDNPSSVASGMMIIFVHLAIILAIPSTSYSRWYL